jgi:hypothetical protein
MTIGPNKTLVTKFDVQIKYIRTVYINEPKEADGVKIFIPRRFGVVLGNAFFKTHKNEFFQTFKDSQLGNPLQ